MKICPVGAELLHTEGQTMVAFPSHANAQKKSYLKRTLASVSGGEAIGDWS